MKVTVKLTVRKDRGSYTDSPHFLSAAGEPDDGAYYSTTGVKPDLLEAAKDATRSMIEFLHQTHGMTKNEAYILCSVAGDLRILEAVSGAAKSNLMEIAHCILIQVDMPNYMVGMMIPRKMLEDVIL
jgi:acetamidase/formamidase